jgi:hypothetical protein
LSVVRLRCTFCHDAVGREEAVHCASCLALHHADCHSEHGRCAVHGCGEQRVLVADPRHGVSTVSARPCPKQRPRPRGLATLGLAVVALASVGGHVFVKTTPSASARAVPAEPGPLAIEKTQREVSLVARDFVHPVAIEEGERLLVAPSDGGYTRVLLERPSRGRVETRFVAEPGDTITVRAGDERLLASPGHWIVIEGRADDRVRIVVTPPRT